MAGKTLEAKDAIGREHCILEGQFGDLPYFSREVRFRAGFVKWVYTPAGEVLTWL